MSIHEIPHGERHNQFATDPVSDLSLASYHDPRRGVEEKTVPQTESKSSSRSQQRGLNMRSSEMTENVSGRSNRLRSFSDILLGFAIVVLLPISAAVFAAESDQLSAIANEQSQTANQLALLSLCYGNSVRAHSTTWALHV
jgi:hypothetical protein